MSDTPFKVVVPPEVLAQMEQTIPADELQTLLNEVQRLAESGELFEQSEPVDLDELQRTDPEEYAALMQALQQQGYDSVEDAFDGSSKPPTLN